MSEIQSVIAREIIDSRGNPTVEAEVTTLSGTGRAAVPSGASTGEHEAVELQGRRQDALPRQGRPHRGEATSRPSSVRPSSGMDALDQAELDKVLIEADGSPNKGKLGANAILAVSMAAARAPPRTRSTCRSGATSAAPRRASSRRR